MYVLLTVIILGVLALGVTGVVSYFQSGAREAKKELKASRTREALASTALRSISAGAELPVFVASDALAEINKTYSKEIN